MSRPNVKFCVPCYDVESWDRSLAKACYTTLCQTAWSFNHAVAIQQGTIIEEARNLCITENRDNQATWQKLNSKYSHYLFLDHDIGFTGANVEQLLLHDADIIGGAYRPKHKPNQYVAGWCDDNGRITRYVTPDQTGLIQVGWVGGGFLLCKREALEVMRFPWFWKTVVYVSNRSMPIGEDIFFCVNAHESGLQVWLDADVILNHEATRYSNETVSDSPVVP